LRPDMRLVVRGRWQELADRVRGVRLVLKKLAQLVAQP